MSTPKQQRYALIAYKSIDLQKKRSPTVIEDRDCKLLAKTTFYLGVLIFCLTQMVILAIKLS